MAVFSYSGLRCWRLVLAMVIAVWAWNAPMVAAAENAAPVLPEAQAAGRETAAALVPGTAKHSPYHAMRMTEKAKKQYEAMWGIDKLRVSSTSSGNLIRFTYRVEMPAQAKALSDKSATPYMYGQTSHAMLQVPVMDKVGPLRQSAAPIAGQEYWMVFSNKGNLVKVGDRVNVVIGAFHADGLMVE